MRPAVDGRSGGGAGERRAAAKGITSFLDSAKFVGGIYKTKRAHSPPLRRLWALANQVALAIYYIHIVECFTGSTP